MYSYTNSSMNRALYPEIKNNQTFVAISASVHIHYDETKGKQHKSMVKLSVTLIEVSALPM